MADTPERPNVVFVFADQWRAQAVGYAGNDSVQTPNLDRLAAGSVNFSRAVSGCPVCSPYRASFLTGQYPLTHGIFLNDARLSGQATSLAEAFKAAGYDTGYVGKWHLDGPDRSGYIPPERRQGFDFWRAWNCSHSYNQSPYYADDSDEIHYWESYDAFAQTDAACDYIRDHAGPDARPFLFVLSWGPPHAPYATAPEQYRQLYNPADVPLPPNVPEDAAETARQELAGYWAHCTALDACVGQLQQTLRQTHLDENTIFVFTSDHGDMLGSQGHRKKQRPWDESIRVPFLLRWPAGLGERPREASHCIDAPDLLPTLANLAGVDVPETAEGRDLSAAVRGELAVADDEAALLMCVVPFAQYAPQRGGREYRGLRTPRYTYVRDLRGPWLLYDNETDPYQLENLCGRPETADVQERLDALLQRRLAERGDAFEPAEAYLSRWGYEVDELLQIPYTGF